MRIRRAAAVALAATLAFAPAACGDDEDGDGAETDEEVDQLDEGAEDVGDDIETEVEEGENEIDDDE
jgi:hypothetical protein